MAKSGKTVTMKVVLARDLYDDFLNLAEGNNCTLQQYMASLLSRAASDEIVKLEKANEMQQNNKKMLDKLRESAFSKRAGISGE